MRLIAAFFTLVALAATVLAGVELSSALAAPTPQATPALVVRAIADIQSDAEDQAPALVWPALFGMPEPPKPPAPPKPVQVAEPQPPKPPEPPKPPRPPLSSLGYELKGVVRTGTTVWGLVSHPTGDQIMRVGDALTDDLTIARIDDEGLWVDVGEDTPELLGFVE